jgi:hypothetical protein
MDTTTSWSEYPPSLRPSTEASLRNSIDTTSLHSSTSSYGSTISEGKRKFSLAAKLNPSRTASAEHDQITREQLPAKIQELLLRVPKFFDNDTARSLRDLARKDIERMPPKHALKVLNEYTRIPRTMRIVDMLKIKNDRRLAISESVLAAKAALTAKIEMASQGSDKEEAALDNLQRGSLGSKDKRTGNQGADSKLMTMIADANTIGDRSSGCPSSMSSQSDVDRVAAVRSSASNRSLTGEPLHLSSGSFYKSSEGSTRRPSSPDAAATFARIAKEVGASPRHAPITAAVVQAITPLNSRTNTAQSKTQPDDHNSGILSTGSKRPSKDNPFASFITERSDTVAEQLPGELRLCYLVHNEVQEQLRQLWRQREESMTAEKVARQVWHKLPKKDFKASIKFEGQILAETLLDRAQLEYMWILRFWERCKVAGW